MSIRNQFLVFMILFLVLANIVDAICTASWVHYGFAEELNPIMAYLLDFSSVAFIGFKIAWTSILVAFLAHFSRYTLTFIGLVVASLVYFAILVQHGRIAIACL